MAAPKGNKFWEMRSKHGKDKIFKTPELMWAAAVEYFNYTDSRKWVRKDWVGKDAFEVSRETDTPYTLTGMCVFFDCSLSWWREFKSNKHKGYLAVITRIEEIIFTQKFEGAAVGVYNPSIIARDLGLVDKVTNEVTGTMRNINITPASDK